MGVPDALGGRTLGLLRMGFAVPFGSGPFRALLPGARQTPQEDNRVGLADAPATQALAASPPDHRRGRWRVCFPKAPRPMPASQEPYYLHHPPQDRRRSVRTGPPSQAAPDGKTSPEGSSPSEPLGGARRPTDTLEYHQGERLGYGGEERALEIVSETAIWSSTGLPAVPVRWVLIRDEQEEFEAQT